MERLDILYGHRFSEEDRRRRRQIWKVLCEDFFQRYVRETDTVLELACGFGEFISNIRAARKIAFDLNPDAAAALPPDVEFHLEDARSLGSLADAEVDVCFVSNFFEHLKSKDEMDEVLAQIDRVLRPGGRVVALQPNIKYAPGDYWDFYDHHLPLVPSFVCRSVSENRVRGRGARRPVPSFQYALLASSASVLRPLVPPSSARLAPSGKAVPHRRP